MKCYVIKAGNEAKCAQLVHHNLKRAWKNKDTFNGCHDTQQNDIYHNDTKHNSLKNQHQAKQILSISVISNYWL